MPGDAIMNEEVYLITGASSGIGRATAAGLARTGATVVMVARDQARGEAVRREIGSQSNNNSVELLIADLSRTSAVRELASEFGHKSKRLNALINCAAVFTGTRTTTPDGFETMFATNYLAPFLLTRLLLPILESTGSSRIVNITAPSTTRPDLDDLQGKQKFGALNAFGASKAADLLFTYAIARKLSGRGITANAYHPGLVRTKLMQEAAAPVRFIASAMNVFGGTSSEQASEGVVQLATSERFAQTTGQLIHKGKVISAPFIEDVDLQEKLWSVTCSLVGLPETI
jgi:NAD(P)-dependent dehydrogenase (short-subunit alcohol dehydrogenase family)